MLAGSLFSGIGGLDHGLARAGFRHAFLCESDPWRRGVLRARFPGVPVYDDVREVGADSGERGQRDGGRDADAGRDVWPPCDLLCGGFPCQDVSVAGRRAGLAGQRSGLFHEFARVADALRPRWLLVENVPGLLSSNGGRDFGVVLGTLADLGYGVGWRILDSRFFGVPQRRRRVFIVGVLADGDPRAAAERAGEVLAVGSRCQGHPASRGEAGADVAVASLSGLGSGGPDDNDGQGGRLIASTLKSQRGKAGGGIGPEETLIATENGPATSGTSGANLAPEGATDGCGDRPFVAAPLSHGSNPNSNMAGRRREDDENLVAYTLNAKAGYRDGDADTNYVTHALTSQGADASEDGTGRGTPMHAQGASVRRLTPTECERLQNLPDGWTNPDGTAPDSRRYAALGDAVTASVAEWIGNRIRSAA